MSFTAAPVLLGSASATANTVTTGNLSTSLKRSTLIAHVVARVPDLTPFSDNFNRSNQNLPNANWTALATPNAAQVRENTLASLAASAASGGEHKFLVPDVGTTNHYVQFRVKNLGPVDDGSFVICRSTTDMFSNFIGVRVANGDLQIFRNDSSGAYTAVVTGTYTAAVDDVIRLDAAGVGSQVFLRLYKNTAHLADFVTSGFSGTRAGVYCRGADQNPWIDEFEHGQIVNVGAFTVTDNYDWYGQHTDWQQISPGIRVGDMTHRVYAIDAPTSISNLQVTVEEGTDAQSISVDVYRMERVDYTSWLTNYDYAGSLIGTPSITLDSLTADSIILAFAARTSSSALNSPGTFTTITDVAANQIHRVSAYQNPGSSTNLAWGATSSPVAAFAIEFLINPALLLAQEPMSFTTSGTLTGVSLNSGSSSLGFSAIGDPEASYLSFLGTSEIEFTSVGTLLGTGMIAGSSSLSLATSGAISGVGVLVGSTTFVLNAQVGSQGSSAIVFTGTGTIKGFVDRAGTTGVTFGNVATMSADGILSGATSLTFGSNTYLSQTVFIDGSTGIVFGDRSHLSLPIFLSTSGTNPNLPYDQTTY